MNATNGAGSIAMLEAAGEQTLAEKVLVDVSNPLDYSPGDAASQPEPRSAPSSSKDSA